MSDRSENSAAPVVLGVLLLLLIVAVGIGISYAVYRQRTLLAVESQRARAAEVLARHQAEVARDAAVAAQAASLRSRDPAFTPDDSIGAAIETVLRAQEAAWNRGDLDAFMEHYWHSDQLTFSSGGDTTRGWTETLNRYRDRYPTKDQMGHLTLSDLEITPLGDAAALVLGQWKVERDAEPLSGNFSLVVRKFDDRWFVVHDHTSRKQE